LGRHRRGVRDHRGQRAAEDGDRAREDETRRLLQTPAGLEECACRVDVHFHAEVELGFRLTAHDRRQVVHDVDVAVDDGAGEVVVGDGAGSAVDARVVEHARRGVDRHQPRQHRQSRDAGERRSGQPAAEKPSRSRHE
jgi:hypothetical protein